MTVSRDHVESVTTCLSSGLVRTLTGLSLNDNPLEVPPPAVVQGGTQRVLQFLRDLLASRDQTGECVTASPGARYDSELNLLASPDQTGECVIALPLVQDGLRMGPAGLPRSDW